MANKLTFEVRKYDGESSDQFKTVATYTGFGHEPFIQANTHRDRLVTDLAAQSQFFTVNADTGQRWRSTRFTTGG